MSDFWLHILEQFDMSRDVITIGVFFSGKKIGEAEDLS